MTDDTATRRTSSETPAAARGLDLTRELAEQIDWHWTHQLRPRLDGLTDDEYLWEPAPGSWSVRRRGASSAPIQGGRGEYVVEFAYPEPVPAPVTTIAWRLAHVVVGVLGARNAQHFGAGAPDGEDWEADYMTWEYAGTAAGALAQLDEAYARWIAGVRGLTPAGLAAACGEDGYEQEPMATLVLHINRELIHHGAEIALLRDLYPHRRP